MKRSLTASFTILAFFPKNAKMVKVPNTNPGSLSGFGPDLKHDGVRQGARKICGGRVLLIKPCAGSSAEYEKPEGRNSTVFFLNGCPDASYLRGRLSAESA